MNGLLQKGFANALLLAVCLTASIGGFVGCRFLPTCNQPSDVIIKDDLMQPVNVLVSHHYQQLKPRRVVITTPMSRSHLLPEQKAFASAVADALRHAGFADAVVARPCRCDTSSIRKGKVDLQQLVDLSSEYSADAVLYCDVVSFSAYDPLQASVSMTLIDAREAVALMAIDGNWDLRATQIETAYLRHLGSYRGDTDFQSRIKYRSPTEFLNFVSKDLARFMSTQ